MERARAHDGLTQRRRQGQIERGKVRNDGFWDWANQKAAEQDGVDKPEPDGKG